MARKRRIAIVLMGLAAALPPGPGFAQETKPGALGGNEAQSMEALLGAAMAELMKPGPRRLDWDKGGVDLHALVAAAPGGAKQNYILSIDKDGDRSIMITGRNDPAGAVPKDWETRTRVGSAPAGDVATDLTIGQLVPPFYFAGLQGRRRVGDSYCSSGPMSGVLYRDKGATDAILPEPMVRLMFQQMVKRFEATTVCWRYDRDGDSYRTSHFLEDGRSLPAFDTMSERLRIVPAGDVEQLLAEERPE